MHDKRILALLKMIEHVEEHGSFDSLCPYCGREEEDGHYDNCELKKAIDYLEKYHGE